MRVLKISTDRYRSLAQVDRRYQTNGFMKTYLIQRVRIAGLRDDIRVVGTVNVIDLSGSLESVQYPPRENGKTVHI